MKAWGLYSRDAKAYTHVWFGITKEQAMRKWRDVSHGECEELRRVTITIEAAGRRK